MLPLAIAVMVASSPGQTYGFTFFNPEIRSALNLSHSQLSAIFMVATIIAAIVLPTIGGLIDRCGLRRSTIVAVAMMALSCALISLSEGPILLLIAFVLLRALGSGTMVLLANNTLAAWFDKRLGMVIAAMQICMAFATAHVPATILELIDFYGWRGAYLALATVLSVGLLPIVVLAYRQSPEEMGMHPDGAHSAASERPLSQQGMTLLEASKVPAYWILLSATSLWGLVGSGIMFHLDSIFASHGLGTDVSVPAIYFLAIAMGTMQVLGGYCTDRVPMARILVSALLSMASCCGILAVDHPDWLTMGCILFGLGQGLMTIVAGTAWARFFGRAHLGRIRGTSIMAGVGGSSVGPLLMGLSIDYQHSFSTALWLFAVFCAGVGLAAFWAHPPLPGTSSEDCHEPTED